MKAILISEKRLDELFAVTLDKLKLDQFTGAANTNMPVTPERIFYTDSMHRAFHYHVCRLKDALKQEDL